MIPSLKTETKRGHCYPEAGVRCDCELPNVGAGNDMLLTAKSSFQSVLRK